MTTRQTKEVKENTTDISGYRLMKLTVMVLLMLGFSSIIITVLVAKIRGII